MLGPEYEEIAAAIPDDHARQSSAADMLAGLSTQDACRVLDLGCGNGRAVDLVRSEMPRAQYVGVDIAVSPEVASRTREDAEFISYDGVSLPFPDASFDTVFSQQVFEHVRYPDRVVAEVRRVLKPGGAFVGSLSYLEPYHSFSIFNYTPYGVYRVLEDNGLRLLEMRPGIEGLSLIARQLSMRRLSRIPGGYGAIDLVARLQGWDARRRNYLKLRLAGHICFRAIVPS